MDNFSNIDSSQDESLSSTFDFINNKIKQGLNIMLPCQVLAVDRTKNRVKVLPLITLLKTNGETMNRAIIDDIPICNLSAGGFIINFPIKVGDFGYIKSNDRDISLFKQSYKNSKPNTTIKNDFADSIFIPDVINVKVDDWIHLPEQLDFWKIQDDILETYIPNDLEYLWKFYKFYLLKLNKYSNCCLLSRNIKHIY